MKKYFVAAFVFLGLIAFYFLISDGGSKQVAKMFINTVTYVGDGISSDKNILDVKKPEVIEDEVSDLDVQQDRLTATNENLANSSYMQLFNDYLLAKTCEKISFHYGYDFQDPSYKEKKSDYDFYELLYETAAPNPTDLLIEKLGVENTSLRQIEVWNVLFNACVDLFDQHADLTSKAIASYNSKLVEFWGIRKYFSEALYLELLVKIAKSYQEKRLKNVLKLIEPYSHLLKGVVRNSYTKSTLSDEEQELIKQKLEDYKLDLNFTSESNQLERNRITDEIRNLNNYLESKEIPDIKKFDESKDQFINLHNQLLDLLPNASAYEFKLILQTITSGLGALDHFEQLRISKNNADLLIIELNQLIYQSNNIKDPEYYDLLIGGAMDLFYCYKGVDCSIDSLLVAHQCFGLGQNPADFSACDTDIETYYLNLYFTNNQLIDVNLLLSYLVDNYGQ